MSDRKLGQHTFVFNKKDNVVSALNITSHLGKITDSTASGAL